ncbi:MAG: hypothetical protein N5P05_003347 [Chroococcopsis gigantea SAG 12.99]|jgi:hypothetical protein|nr:hypothetical protein [Chlorogloea purpurea SAG 13.99]MDV3001741.1 hypothetical protein [Chroococcopsis gigantea SAG 12.99]
MYNQPPEKPTPEIKDLPEIMFPPKPNLYSPLNTEPAPESVKVVERLSGILSPYFIVVVGLFLYDRNFFLGFILIIVGILSILGIRWDNIKSAITEVKKFFGS